MTDPHECTYHTPEGYCTWEQKFCAMTEPTWNGEMWCWMELQAKPEQEAADELAAKADHDRKAKLEDGP